MVRKDVTTSLIPPRGQIHFSNRHGENSSSITTDTGKLGQGMGLGDQVKVGYV